MRLSEPTIIISYLLVNRNDYVLDASRLSYHKHYYLSLLLGIESPGSVKKKKEKTNSYIVDYLLPVALGKSKQGKSFVLTHSCASSKNKQKKRNRGCPLNCWMKRWNNLPSRSVPLKSLSINATRLSCRRLIFFSQIVTSSLVQFDTSYLFLVSLTIN